MGQVEAPDRLVPLVRGHRRGYVRLVFGTVAGAGEGVVEIVPVHDFRQVCELYSCVEHRLDSVESH